MFDRLLRSEPEVLLPLLTVDGGPALELYRSLIAELLRAEIQAGRAATADPDRVAEVIARLAISLVLTRDGTVSLDDPESMAALVKHVLTSNPAATHGGERQRLIVVAKARSSFRRSDRCRDLS